MTLLDKSGLPLRSGPSPFTVLCPVDPSDVKLVLSVFVTKDNRIELSGPVGDENLSLELLRLGIERIKAVHRSPHKSEVMVPS